MSTYTPKKDEIERAWFVVDAEDLILGRMCTEVARILRGKHKPTYAQHIDTGDHVIIVNAEKVAMTSNKKDTKMVYRHSGFPGGLKTMSYGRLLETKPEQAIRKSVAGMIPKNRLGAQQLTKLKVYAGPTHPHQAQNPTELKLDQAKARV